MSALGPEADILKSGINVRKVPKADIGPCVQSGPMRVPGELRLLPHERAESHAVVVIEYDLLRLAAVAHRENRSS